LAVVAGTGVVIGGALVLRHCLERPVAHIRTGEQRRSLHPLEKGLGPSAQLALAAKDVQIDRKFHTLGSGEQIFYQIITPAGREPTHIVVFLHGYTSNSELYLEAMCEVARQGAMVVMPDLPTHGRSDGLLCYIPDWWAWVELIWEFMDSVVTPLRTASGKTRRVFLSGISMGGGLTVCLGVMRPNFFDGLIPIAPMLFVADDVKPPKIVQILFRRLLGPFKLTLPVTPSKDLDGYDFRFPEQGPGFTEGNLLSMRGLKPRLATACELGFTFPEWMELKLKEVRTPILILHGRDDKVTDPGMSQRLVEEAPVSDKQLKLYDGAYHCELLCCLPGHAKFVSKAWTSEQKAQTTQCLKDMGDWIAARI